MSNELIETIKQALCQQSPFDDDKPDDYEAEAQAAYAAIADRIAALEAKLAEKDALIEHAGGDGVTEGDKRGGKITWGEG